MVYALFFCLSWTREPPHLHSFPTRRSSDLARRHRAILLLRHERSHPDDVRLLARRRRLVPPGLRRQENPAEGSVRVDRSGRSEEHTSELQSQSNLVCRLLLEKQKLEFTMPA